MLRTSNPALSEKVFRSSHVAAGSSEVMTLDGTVNKSIFGVLLTIAAGYFSFTNLAFAQYYFAFILLGLVLALIIIFKQTLAPVLTPAYAIVEGLALGGLSSLIDSMYPGIAFQAVSLTFATLFCLLFAYKSGLLKATPAFKRGVIAATGAIFVVYILSFVLGMFGVGVPYIHGSGVIGIGFSLFVVCIAAMNLVLDFDFIEQASASGQAPKYMEWMGAFGLLVTLVWLYIEILHLLMKLRD